MTHEQQLEVAGFPAGSAAAASLGRLGRLRVGLAASPAEVRAAQALRHEVFHRGRVTAAPGSRAALDADGFDPICDHLLVWDEGPVWNQGPAGGGDRNGAEVVATCRLLRQEVAARHHGFYTAGEFAIEPLVARRGGSRFLELGRSCVRASHRDKRSVELLWHGIWSYALRHRIDVMIGCGSLHGTDPQALALPLSFLHHFAGAPEEWRVAARRERHVEMNRMPAGAIDPRLALRSLPPLLKGYLRLGAFVGEGAVVDEPFGTTDVCIVLPVARISARYLDHYGREADRFSSPADEARRRVDA